MGRIFYFDNIKGFLILCIVLIHTINTYSDFYGFNWKWLKLLYFFAIPLFIFLTGKFAKKSKKTPRQRSIKMLIIFLISQVLVTLYYKYGIQIISPDKSILIPRFTLWYLLTISCLYSLEYIFRKYSFKTVFTISLIVALTSGFISGFNQYLSLMRTITSLPFFVLGYYSEEINVIELSKKYKNVILVLVIGITIWFLFNQSFFLFKDVYLKYNYYRYDTTLECFLKRSLIYLISFIFCSFILNIISKEKNIFTIVGNKTLVIYLAHGVLLKTILYFDLFIENKVLGIILTYLSVIIIGTILGTVINKIKRRLINKEKVYGV